MDIAQYFITFCKSLVLFSLSDGLGADTLLLFASSLHVLEI